MSLAPDFGWKAVVHDSVSSTGIPFSLQYLDYAQDTVHSCPQSSLNLLYGFPTASWPKGGPSVPDET